MRRTGIATWFSGRPTIVESVARWMELREREGEPVERADVAAAFQEAVVDVLSSKAIDACQTHGVGHLLLGGGVAANSRLRAVLGERCSAAGIRLQVPRPTLCTDNGAMVAALRAALVEAGRAPSNLGIPVSSSLSVDQVVVH